MDIVVTEGPAVQGIYQQVIRQGCFPFIPKIFFKQAFFFSRDYPSLIGASAAVWESKRRRTGSCETLVRRHKCLKRFM